MKKKVVAACMTVALAAVAFGGATLAYFTDEDSQKNTFTVGDVEILLDETAVDPDDAPGDRTSEDQAFGVIMPGIDFVKDPRITNIGSQSAWVFLEIDLNKYVSLINLMGVDAYANKVGGLEGKYPGFCDFVGMLVDNSELRAEVLGRWFKGIDHSQWEVMNLNEISALVEQVSNGKNPAHLKVVVGYKQPLATKGTATFMTGFGMPKTVTQSMMDGDDAYYLNNASKSNFNTDESNFNITFTAYAVQKAGIDSLSVAYKAINRD